MKVALSTRKYLILFLLTGFVIAFDQLTKMIVIDHFWVGRSIHLIPGFLSLTYIQNTGAAFGILAHSDPTFRVPFFVIVPVVALGAIAYIFRKIPADDLRLSCALSLVVGGAVGNLIDRVRLKYVVDFLDFHWFDYHFPAFNVADSAICIGVGILMLDLLLQDMARPSSEKKESQANASASH